MPAHSSTSPSQVMCLLQYTPRIDALEGGYHEWLKTVGNPFYNGVTGVVLYENWVVRDSILGDADYTHLDFMYVESRESVEQIWKHPDVVRFSADWSRMWGQTPDAEDDQSANYHMVVCEEIAGPKLPRRTDWCLFLPYVPRSDALSRNYDAYLREIDNPFFNSDIVPEVVSDANWRKTRDLVGSEWWTDLDLMMIESPEAASGLFTNAKAAEFMAGFIRDWGSAPGGGAADNFSGVLAELIAGPRDL